MSDAFRGKTSPFTTHFSSRRVLFFYIFWLASILDANQMHLNVFKGLKRGLVGIQRNSE